MRVTRAVSCCLIAASPLVGPSLANAGAMPAGVTNWYHVELWRFPDPSQDPSDPNSLPDTAEEVLYEQSVHYDTTASSFDFTWDETAPRSGSDQDSPSKHRVRVAASSDSTHLRAAFQSSLSDFRVDNLRPGYYRQEDLDTGAVNVVADYGLWSGQTFLTTVIDDWVTLAELSSRGSYNLTYVLNLSGTSINDLMVTGPGELAVLPLTNGIIKAYGSELYGPYFQLPQNETVQRTVSLTVQARYNEATFTRLALSFENDLVGYVNTLSDEDAAQTFLDGSLDWSYASTVSIEKLIIELPQGANPDDYSFSTQSGTNYLVEYSHAQVPAPGVAALLLGGLAGLGLFRRRAEPCTPCYAANAI